MTRRMRRKMDESHESWEGVDIGQLSPGRTSHETTNPHSVCHVVGEDSLTLCGKQLDAIVELTPTPHGGRHKMCRRCTRLDPWHAWINGHENPLGLGRNTNPDGTRGGWVHPEARVSKRATIGRAAVVWGGTVNGGTISGGTVWGGTVNGGTISGGTVWDGTVNGGVVNGGTVWGGTVNGGVIHGGEILGGVVLGGTIWGGKIWGGAVRGGTIRGGNIWGGAVKGGAVRCDWDVVVVGPVGNEPSVITAVRDVGSGWLVAGGCSGAVPLGSEGDPFAEDYPPADISAAAERAAALMFLRDITALRDRSERGS